MKKKLVALIETMEPVRRKRLILLGGGTVFVLFLWVVVEATSGDGGKIRRHTERKVEYSLLNGRDVKEVSFDKLSGRIKQLSEDFGQMCALFQQQEARIDQASEALRQRFDELKRQTDELNTKTRALDERLVEARQNQLPLPELPEKGRPPKSSVPARDPGNRFASGQPPQIPDAAVSPDGIGLKIRVVDGSSGHDRKSGAQPAAASGKDGQSIKQSSSDRSRKKTQDPVLPSGSILSGTLITGMDAPTSNQSRRDPFPALLRVKHEAILPNKYRMDIRECFLIASGYGDLSSERAYLRAESLSCVKRDGAIIDVTMDAYAVGEDGKAGVRGRLVSKNGQIIGNALLAGFVSGVTNAFAPQKVRSLNLSGAGVSDMPYQYPSPEMVAGQGFAGGVKGAAEQIADYYLEMAKNIFPVVEVDAGRQVDFILVRGVAMREVLATGGVGRAPGGYGTTAGNDPYQRGQGATMGAYRGAGLGGGVGSIGGYVPGAGTGSAYGSGYGGSGLSGAAGGLGRYR